MKKVIGITAALIFSALFQTHAAEGQKNLAGLSFTAPAAWKETRPSSSMRAFQFEVPGEGQGGPAEMAVFYFGKGMGGAVQANIDRWKGQFTELTGEKTGELNPNGIKTTVVFLKGTFQPTGGPMMAAQGDPVADYAVLGAIAEAPEGTVFFKLTGPEAVLNSARADFDSLVNSFKPA